MEKAVIGGVTVSSINMDAAKAMGKQHWESEYEKLGDLRSYFVAHWKVMLANKPNALELAELKFSSMMNDLRKWIDETFPLNKV